VTTVDREFLASLDDGQASALAAVAAHYLSHTRFAEAEDCSMHPDARREILRRREVCALVTGGAR
jgi:hypothetical protein